MRRTFTALALALAVSLVAVSFTSVTAWAELGPISLDAETDWLFEDDAPDPADRDPFEPVNRGIFGFNEVVYGWVFEPVSVAYQWVIPGPGRRAVRRFFSNLGEPVTLVNDLLRFRPLQAGSSGARFLINTTAGVGGLFDPATAWGLEAHTSGFGGTLAVYRVPSGPYLVMPIMGPSTARDAVGGLVDGVMRPDTWLLAATPRLIMAAGGGFSTYDIERERLDALRTTSVDFYAALRSAYLLDRDARIEILLAGE